MALEVTPKNYCLQQALVALGDGKVGIKADKVIPTISTNEILVKVKAVTLNPTDYKVCFLPDGWVHRTCLPSSLLTSTLKANGNLVIRLEWISLAISPRSVRRLRRRSIYLCACLSKKYSDLMACFRDSELAIQ